MPCFIRWPNGDLGKPRAIDELSHVQDLLPTLADLCGAKSHLPKTLDGVSLAPIFRSEEKALADRMLVINYSRMPGFKVGYTKENPAIPKRDGAAVLWKHWRLLENRQLYDIKADPHQDRDVADKHPAVVAKMRAHLETWWDSVKDDVMEPQRVVIGSSEENPMLLSACEWLDVFVDQQVQIRRGATKNGVWHLTVAKSGTYEFELRRWPCESGLKLADACSATRVTDGTYIAGQALPIAQARLQIGAFDATAKPTQNGQAVKFSAELEAGPVEMQTWMQSETGKDLCGAYYVYIELRE